MNTNSIIAPMLGNQATNTNIVQQRIAYSGPVQWSRGLLTVPQFSQSIWIPNNHPMRTLVQSELIKIRQKLKLNIWKPLLMYFIPMLLYIATVTTIYILLKQNQYYKPLVIIDVAFYIVIIIPVASLMFCMFRVQKKDSDAIIRELKAVNERFAQEGVNLVLRVKLRNGEHNERESNRYVGGMESCKYIQVLQKHEIHEMS